MVGSNGLEPLKQAIQAAEMAGTGARVMCHIGGAPGQLSDLLDLLRPGDILETHTYSGAGNNVVQDGKVLPAALEAKRRGVLFDVGHGGGSFDYTVAEPAIDQGLTPDTLGSDIHAVSANTPGMPFMPWLMSKFLNMGFSLEEVIRLSTVNPAQVIDRVDKLGTLQLGAPGDVSILELVEEPVTFVDTKKNERKGERYLKPVTAVVAGVPFRRGKPFPAVCPSLAAKRRNPAATVGRRVSAAPVAATSRLEATALSRVAVCGAGRAIGHAARWRRRSGPGRSARCHSRGSERRRDRGSGQSNTRRIPRRSPRAPRRPRCRPEIATNSCRRCRRRGPFSWRNSAKNRATSTTAPP